MTTDLGHALTDARLAEVLNEIESAGGLVTPEQEALLAGYSVAQLIRAAIALKAVRDDLEMEVEPAKERIRRAKDVIDKLDNAYDRVRETMRQKARDEGWEKAEDPDDLASVSIQEGKERYEPIGQITDVPEVCLRYVPQLDSEAVDAYRAANDDALPPGVKSVQEKYARISLRKKGKALVAALGIRGMMNGSHLTKE